MKKSIFGCGAEGKKALREIKEVVCFIDNDSEKQGTLVEGVPVVSLEEWQEQYEHCQIVIACKAFPIIIEQLEEKGIYNYKVWTPLYIWFGKKKTLVLNPYETRNLQMEEKIVKYEEYKRQFDYLNNYVEALWRQKPLFALIEIETYNRCNGVCEFCPVSVKNESRPEYKMSEVTFEKIVNELAEIDWHGCLCLYSNNEPFLDERIVRFSRMVREKVPHAKTHLYSNGTCLTMDKFVEIIDYLDELIIDNYNQQLELIPPVKKIKEYCEIHPELIDKVTIVLRNPKEILEARGGDAPNRKNTPVVKEAKCIYPFRQMVIRPDGKVSLCCNDALGKYTLGDVNENTLVEIWYGEKYGKIREMMYKEGRAALEVCSRCDTKNVV